MRPCAAPRAGAPTQSIRTGPWRLDVRAAIANSNPSPSSAVSPRPAPGKPAMPLPTKISPEPPGWPQSPGPSCSPLKQPPVHSSPPLPGEASPPPHIGSTACTFLGSLAMVRGRGMVNRPGELNARAPEHSPQGFSPVRGPGASDSDLSSSQAPSKASGGVRAGKN